MDYFYFFINRNKEITKQQMNLFFNKIFTDDKLLLLHRCDVVEELLLRKEHNSVIHDSIVVQCSLTIHEA